jgi:hypothetical protein
MKARDRGAVFLDDGAEFGIKPGPAGAGCRRFRIEAELQVVRREPGVGPTCRPGPAPSACDRKLTLMGFDVPRRTMSSAARSCGGLYCAEGSETTPLASLTAVHFPRCSPAIGAWIVDDSVPN